MLVISDLCGYVPILVDAKKFADRWERNSRYVKYWEGPPLCRWFDHRHMVEPVAFYPARAWLDEKNMIDFMNGRHRTQWMLGLGLSSIPVCILAEEVGRWVDLGIVHEDKQPIQVYGLEVCCNRKLSG